MIAFEIIIGLAYLISILIVIFLIFIQKKSAKVTMGWLIVFMFLPVLGLILYFFLGSTYKFKILNEQGEYKNLEEKYLSTLKLKTNALEPHTLTDPVVNKYKDIVLMNDRNGGSYYTENNNAIVYNNAEEKFDQMFKDIKEANDSIHVLYFIFKTKDVIGRKLINLLTIKAKEGVKVRLVYDRLGSIKDSSFKDFKDLIKAGGEVIPYLPSKVKTLLEANYRMHRKIVVIDGKIGYTGGINVGDEYLGNNPKRHPWRDTAIRLTGEAVYFLQARFLTDFMFLNKQKLTYKQIKIKNAGNLFPEPIKNKKMGVQIVTSGPDTNFSYGRDTYIKMIGSAKEYLYIQSPYVVPDETMLDSLRLAAASGVDVRLIIPGKPDKKGVYYITLSFVDELLKYGVRVYKHEGFIHSKSIVMDDAVTSIGTMNLDVRSFYLDYEVNAVVFNSAFAKENKEIFNKDLKECKEINKEAFKKRGIKSKILEGIWRLIAPLT